MALRLIFKREKTLKQKLSTPRRKRLENQGVVYSVRYKRKKFKMEYIGETGRQLKIRIKGHKADWKFDFRKTLSKKKKIKYLVFRNIRRSEEINQIEIRSRILQKKVNIGNVDQRKHILLLNTRLRHHFWIRKTNARQSQVSG